MRHILVWTLGLLTAGLGAAPTEGVVAINPLTLLTVAAAASATQKDAAPPPAVGNLALAVPEANRETQIGIAWFPGFFDLDLQSRVYADAQAKGWFAGTYASAEWVSFRTYRDPARGVTFASDGGAPAALLGLRLGGNVGCRFWFGTWGLTPRIGLVLPVFWLWAPADYTRDEGWSLYGLTALTRTLEVGFTVDLGTLPSS